MNMIGFGFTSDWLRKWHKYFKPITKHINAKPKQMQNTFDTYVEPAQTVAVLATRLLIYM